MNPLPRLSVAAIAFILTAYVFSLPQTASSTSNDNGALGKYSKPVNDSYGKATKDVNPSNGNKKSKKKEKNKSNSSAGSFGDKINKAFRKTTNQEK